MKDWDELTPEEQEDVQEALEKVLAARDRDSAEVAMERNLPSRRRFDPLFGQVLEPLTKCFNNDSRGEYASFAELLGSAEALFDPDRSGLRTLRAAFDMFEEVAGEDETRSHDLRYAVSCLMLVALSHTADHVYQEADREKLKLKGLTAKAAAASEMVNRAQAIAGRLWGEDTSRSLRVGEMADHVYGQLLDEGVDIKQLPDLERVRKWIRPVAPDYAKRPGPTPRKS